MFEAAEARLRERMNILPKFEFGELGYFGITKKITTKKKNQSQVSEAPATEA